MILVEGACESAHYFHAGFRPEDGQTRSDNWRNQAIALNSRQ
jgi:hypothetical protein